MKELINVFVVLITTGFGYSQNTDNQQKIKTNLEDYFHLERENIHVQFNKTLYISNENIGFKGYVFNKQSNLPNLNTTNVQLVIYDMQGKAIQKQLLYTTSGTFDGIVHLDEKTTSGKYRFLFYTNWMNNFMEDESFSQTIEVINKEEKYNLKLNQPDFASANTTIQPESGTIILGIENTVGIKIADCNQQGIPIAEGLITNSKGTTIATFFTNKMGYGKFNFTPDPNEVYTLKIASDKLKLQKQLPQAKNSGITITYNNNLPNNAFEVAIKTNLAGINIYQNKKFTLLIHQNGKSIQKELNFNDKNPIQTLNFDKNDLSNGVNSIRVIDENLNEIAERLFYLNKQTKETPLLETQIAANDTILLLGKLNSKIANLSVSILPVDNACNEEKNSILGSIYLNAYLEKSVPNNFSYFDRQNVTRAFDMELLMLNQEKSKYYWNNIMTNKPKETYKFSKGITINGTIVKSLNPKKNYKVVLVSLKNKIYEEAIVKKNNTFSFDNFFARDSTSYQLELMDDSNIPIETKMITNLLFNNENFQKKLNFETSNCSPPKNLNNTFTFNDPELDKKNIVLSEVEIKNNYKKPVYNHQTEGTNMLAKGYKIGDSDFGTVLDFIGKNGYATGVNEEFSVYITDTRTLHSVNNSTVSPTVYIDDLQITDFNVLYSLDLNDFDEIYIDKTGSSNISFGGLGTIKAYFKKGANRGFFTKKHTTLIVKSGFRKTQAYKTTGFPDAKVNATFGTLNWSPNVFLDSGQIFEVKFPKANQQEIQVLIEGFTIDGQFISEIKKMNLMTKS